MSIICSKMAPCLTPFKPLSRITPCLLYMSCMVPPLVHDTLSTTSHAWHLVYHLSCMSPCLPHIMHGTWSTTYHAWCHVYILSCVTPCLPPVKLSTISSPSRMVQGLPPCQSWHNVYHRSSMALFLSTVKHGMAVCLPVPHDKLGTLSTVYLAWHHVYHPVKHTCLEPILRYSFGKRQLFMVFFHIIIKNRHAFPFLPWNIPFSHANNILTG